MSALETASVLAFERKIAPSDAVFSAGNWDARTTSENWRDLTICPKSVRGTISNRLKTKDQDPIKLDAAIEKPNLQTVDVAALPKDADTLKIRFTLRVLAGTGQPSACNNLEYQKKLTGAIDGYVKDTVFWNWLVAMLPISPMAASYGATELVRRRSVFKLLTSKTGSR